MPDRLLRPMVLDKARPKDTTKDIPRATPRDITGGIPRATTRDTTEDTLKGGTRSSRVLICLRVRKRTRSVG